MRLLCRRFGNRVLNNSVGLVFGQRIDFPNRNHALRRLVLFEFQLANTFVVSFSLF